MMDDSASDCGKEADLEVTIVTVVLILIESYGTVREV